MTVADVCTPGEDRRMSNRFTVVLEVAGDALDVDALRRIGTVVELHPGDLVSAPPCPTCGGVMRSFCMRCRGRSGGAKLTPRKRVQLKRAARRPRKRQRSD